MLKRIFFISALLSAAGAAPLASANTLDQGQWLTTLTGGTSLPSHDTLQTAAIGSIDAGRFDPSLAGETATPSLEHLRFSDAFRAGTGFGIEAGYMVQNDVEAFARLGRTQLDGRNVRIGSVALPTDSVPITADFDDLDSWGLNLGLRYFFVDNGRMRAFLDGYAGANRNDAMNARLAIGNAAPLDTEYLPQRTKFSTGIDGGVSVQLTDATDLSLSVGAQYVTGRVIDSPMIDALGLDGGAVHEEHWSVPMNLGLTMRF